MFNRISERNGYWPIVKPSLDQLLRACGWTVAHPKARSARFFDSIGRQTFTYRPLKLSAVFRDG